MKIKILSSMLVIVVAISMAIGGTFAEFSSQGTSSGNTFTAGTLHMHINGNDNVSSTWKTPANWAPGDTTSGTLQFTNTGNVDAKHLYFNFTGLTYDSNGDASNMLDHIFVTAISETYNSKTISSDVASLASTVGDKDTKLSIRDLASTAWWANDDGTANNDGVVLSGGDKSDYSITFTFQFDPACGNDYQGDSAGFNLNLNATQNSPAATAFH